MDSRRLFIVADDFALTDTLSSAVLDAVDAGIVRGVSAAVTEEALLSKWTVRLYKEASCDKGVHLVLFSSSSKKLYPLTKVHASLLNRDGSFKTPTALRMLLPISGAVLNSVEEEFRAQLLRYRSTGLPMHFINSHRHSTMHSQIFEVCARLAREFSVPYVRLVNEPFLCTGAPLSPRSALPLLMNGHRVRCEASATRYGIRHADHYRGFINSLRFDSASIEKIIEYLPPGLTELAIHPGSLYSGEVALLSSNKTRALIEKNGIDFCTASSWLSGS
jgi:chitin disaccharide deacetylase